MANRVILGSFQNTYALKISVPGADVLQPGLDIEQTVFDSQWTEVAWELMSGVFTAARGVGTQINFGFTLPSPPIVIVRWIGDNNRYITYTSQRDRRVQTYPTLPLLTVYVDKFIFNSWSSVSPIFDGFNGVRPYHYTVYRTRF